MGTLTFLVNLLQSDAYFCTSCIATCRQGLCSKCTVGQDSKFMFYVPYKPYFRYIVTFWFLNGNILKGEDKNTLSVADSDIEF
jgi:hypothetical protein